MGKYDEELDVIENSLHNCPTDFLRRLLFRLEVLVLERDTGYQHWLRERSREGVKLTVVKTEE